MRGKTRPETRFNKFQLDVIKHFQSQEFTSEFVHHLKNIINIQKSFETFIDEDGALNFDRTGPPTSIFQILKLSDKPVLLRNLEAIGDCIWGRDLGKRWVFTAIIVLISTNLIDYSYRDFDGQPSDVLEFFIKDE